MQDSWERCPRSSCIDHGKPLRMDVGADETRGDLTVQHRCWECGFVEWGPSTPEAARRSSTLVRQVAAENLRLRRLAGFSRDTGVEIPMRKDVPEVADA